MKIKNTDEVKIIRLKSIEDVPIPNIGGIITRAELKYKGQYTCIWNGQRTKFILVK